MLNEWGKTNIAYAKPVGHILVLVIEFPTICKGIMIQGTTLEHRIENDTIQLIRVMSEEIH